MFSPRSLPQMGGLLASYGADEEGTLEGLKTLRRQLFDPKLSEYRGRIVKTTGDGMLVEYPSVVDAVRCAVEVQRKMARHNSGVLTEGRNEFRVGINLDDVIVEGATYSETASMSLRGSKPRPSPAVCVSRTVRNHVRDKLDFVFEDLGENTAAASGQALPRGAALPEHEWRPGAGVFC